MKTSQKYFAITGLVLTALIWPSWRGNAQEAEASGEDLAAREASRHLELQDENGHIPPDAWINAYAEKDAMPFLPEAWGEFASAAQVQAGVKGGNWVSIGPGNTGGRIRSIIIRPPDANDINARKIWVGGVAGGVWKSTNGGEESWTTNTDRLANLAVNCMAIEPGYHAQNQDVLYAGTGEGFGNVDGVTGNGIFKTTDGGDTWNQLPSTANNPDFAWVNRLAISPNSPQLLLAAVRVYPPQGGVLGKILRSTNGGTNWTTTLTVAGDPMTDVRFRPNNTVTEIPDIPSITCLASSYNGGIYYSIDDGATWITRADNLGLPPPAYLQRVELAYSRSNPLIVYASKAGVTGSPTELFRSDNGGFSFTSRGHPYAPTVPGGLPGASWYNNVLWVDPTDPNANTVIVGGVYILRTTDGGDTWVHGGSGAHLDHHALVEDPAYGNGTPPNRILYGANDGGVYRTTDILAPSPQWTSLNKQLAVTQFYGAAGHGPSGKIIGGTQDNGTVRFTPSLGLDHWETLCSSNYCGGDTAACAVDQSEEPYFYSEIFGLQIFRNRNDGVGGDFIWGGPGHANGIPYPPNCGNVPCADGLSPFVIDPSQRERILAGGSSLWRTNNARTANAVDVCWREIKSPIPNNNISAIAIAQGDSNLIWVGYNRGSVSYTTNGTLGGMACPSSSPTPSWTTGDPNHRLPQNRRCTDIAIAYPVQGEPPESLRKVYVTFDSFPLPMETSGNVWRRESDGVTWTDLAYNRLPRVPVYSLVISPANPDFLYVGTEVGVFASSDGGRHWSPAFGGSSADTLVYSLVSSGAASEPDIIYVGTEDGVFASKDEGETWEIGFGGPANTPARELFWMINGANRQLVVATHGRGMFSLTAAQ
jgi:photosystem II stability/assembly factor-like uncharacterized protein